MGDSDLNGGERERLWDVGEALAEIREHLPERKSERLQLRVTPTEKADVEYMTDLLGVSAADYLMHLHRRAVKDLERRNPQRTRHDENETRNAAEGVSERNRAQGEASRGNENRRARPRRRRGRNGDDGTAGVGARL